MGIRLGHGGVIHADAIESQPADSVTRCGRSHERITPSRSEVTCKTCLKFTASDAVYAQAAAAAVTAINARNAAKDTLPVEHGFTQTTEPVSADNGTAFYLGIKPVGDNGADTPGRPWHELSSDGASKCGLPWRDNINYGAGLVKCEACDAADNGTVEIMNVRTNADGSTETIPMYDPKVVKPLANGAMCPQGHTVILTVGGTCADCENRIPADNGTVEPTPEEFGAAFRFAAQAQRGAGEWVTFPDAGPWTDRYEAIAWTVGAAVMVPDSSWRVISVASGEIIWESPVFLVEPVSQGMVPFAPAVTAAEPRRVLAVTGGAMATGSARYDRLDGGARYRAVHGKRKGNARRQCR